jgi:hypothetical protein
MKKNSNKESEQRQQETLVSGSKLRISDLRMGNILSYTTSEGEVADAVIDWQDLKWLDEDSVGFNSVHKPIQLTEFILPFLGFRTRDGHWTNGVIDLMYITNDDYFQFEIKFPSLDWRICDIKNVHQLQNLYFALTGKELKLDR